MPIPIRKWNEFFKTHPTFVFSPLLVPYMFFWDTLYAYSNTLPVFENVSVETRVFHAVKTPRPRPPRPRNNAFLSSRA